MLGEKDDYSIAGVPAWIDQPDFLHNEYRMLVIENIIKNLPPPRKFVEQRKDAIAKLKEKYPELGIVDNLSCEICGCKHSGNSKCPVRLYP